MSEGGRRRSGSGRGRRFRLRWGRWCCRGGGRGGTFFVGYGEEGIEGRRGMGEELNVIDGCRPSCRR